MGASEGLETPLGEGRQEDTHKGGAMLGVLALDPKNAVKPLKTRANGQKGRGLGGGSPKDENFQQKTKKKDPNSYQNQSKMTVGNSGRRRIPRAWCPGLPP